MKKNVFLFLAASTAVLAFQTAKADVLADWTFETSGLGSSTPNFLPGANTATTNFYAELGLQAGTAAAIGLHAGAATYTSPAGNGSTKALSSALWATGDYYQFSVSTIGFQNITLSYDQNGSATGPSTFQLAYSIDGTTFNTFGSTYVMPAGVTWNGTTSNPLGNTSYAYDLSGVTALNNLGTVYFRIVDSSTTSINGGTVGTGGTDRVDNFIVNGIATVPEPSTIALAALGGGACLLALRRKR